MAEFRLGSIDWSSVRLLHGEHLTHETAYLEELIRWVLHFGPPCGIVEMSEDSLGCVQSSDTVYRFTLRNCRALTPQGYWVDLGDQGPSLDLNSQHHLGEVVKLYLGVATDEKDSRDLAPARSSALVECRSRWRHYVLDHDNTGDNCDYLQIAQVLNRDGTLAPDASYLPDCRYLASHPQLVREAKEIEALARTGLAKLAEYTPETAPADVSALAGRLAGGLGGAAVIADWQARPVAYVERLCSVLSSVQGVACLCPAETGFRDDALNAIGDALEFVRANAEAGLPLGPTLQRIKRALELLTKLFQHLVIAQPPSPPPPPDLDRSEQPFRKIGGAL